MTKSDGALKNDARCDALLKKIEEDYRATCFMTGRFSLPPRIKTAIRQVPRHLFVPPDMQALSYENHPLPIGHGQTISQPYIVALMTDLLSPMPEHIVLEIGTGSGYQAAILARLVQNVYSLEIVPALACQAKERLRRLGCLNVEVQEGNGYNGWPEYAPYDGIIVTAATPVIPNHLIDQLKTGGKMVLPRGSPHGRQHLIVVTRKKSGALALQNVLAVAFVPMTGSHDDAAEHWETMRTE